MKRTLFLLFVAGLVTDLPAIPLEPFVKGLAKLAEEAGTISKGVAASRAAAEAAGAASKKFVPTNEPKPNLTSEPISKAAEDAMAYKMLRGKAIQGDATAMMKMSEMTLSKQIYDPGEPYRGYWLFQASKINAEGVKRLAVECSISVDKRRTDLWFDSACATTDNKYIFRSK